MAFFEQLGKKITDAGQGVAQQTKNLADIAKLNSAISEKEKRIEQLYYDIGVAFFNAHKNDTVAENGGMIGEINTLMSEIEQCRENIKQIKGVIKCSNCGAEIPINSTFCSACGAKTSQCDNETPVENEEKVCPSCGAAVPEGNLFCTQCGTKL